jgi:altronate dehydratase
VTVPEYSSTGRKKALKGMSKDNVAVLLSSVTTGDVIDVDCDGFTETLTCTSNIPAFHKVAIAEISQGDAVIRRGTPIGLATQAIMKGELVHVHNIRSQRAQIAKPREIAAL